MKLWTRLLFLATAAAPTIWTASCGGGGESRDPATTTVSTTPPRNTTGLGGSVGGRGGTGGAGGASGAGGSIGGAAGGGTPAGGTDGTPAAGGTGGSAAPTAAPTPSPDAGVPATSPPVTATTPTTTTTAPDAGVPATPPPVTPTTPTTTTTPTTPTTTTPVADVGTCRVCTKWSDPVPHGQLPSILPEVSGLAASPRYPGLVYTHNDSGDSARFFAIDENAAVVAEMRLSGASAVDWEDIAVGPCPSGSCVYVGDIGDNSATRADYTIYRVAEPAARPASGSVTTVQYESFRFLYPDDSGRHNSEALLVHPTSGRLFVIIKMGGRPAVYELPQPLVPGSMQTLVKVATLKLPDADSIVTGGDFHPCGDRMLVRTVDSLYEFSAPGAGVDALFAATPVKVPLAAQEPQGEAVTYSPDGRRYFTSSETGDNPQPLNIVSCVSP